MRWLLAALLPFAAACGEDVTPVAPTTPVPEPRVCTDELERARAYIDSILPREWDGTPFRFDLFDHFPEIAGADYLDGQLEEVRGLAERIALRQSGTAGAGGGLHGGPTDRRKHVGHPLPHLQRHGCAALRFCGEPAMNRLGKQGTVGMHCPAPGTEGVEPWLAA